MAAGHRIPSQRSGTSTAAAFFDFAPFLADFDLGVLGDAFSCVFDLVTPCGLAFFDDACFAQTLQCVVYTV